MVDSFREPFRGNPSGKGTKYFGLVGRVGCRVEYEFEHTPLLNPERSSTEKRPVVLKIRTFFNQEFRSAVDEERTNEKRKKVEAKMINNKIVRMFADYEEGGGNAEDGAGNSEDGAVGY